MAAVPTMYWQTQRITNYYQDQKPDTPVRPQEIGRGRRTQITISLGATFLHADRKSYRTPGKPHI